MSVLNEPVAALHSVGRRVKQYALIGASGLGLTGGRAPAGPLHAQIGVSDPCNHRCVMCWDHPPDENASEATAERFGGRAPGLMSLRHFRGVVDDLHRLGTRRIDVVGRGEPLLNDEVTDMVAYARRRGFMVTLCSNASRLSEERSRALVDAGLDRLNVSLNAGTPETYPRIHVTETPENYRRVKANLARLTAVKREAGRSAPWVKLSFVVSSRNSFEVEAMVRVAAEVGAEEAYFVHTVVHDGTRELALSQEQYQELMMAVPGARRLADELGVTTNLGSFAATVPTYLRDEIEGPPVVPCYVGWYFTVILGNGSVMPCCQCASPIERISDERSFGEIWSSERYAAFRDAARRLPANSPELASCECDRCMLRPRNISIHNTLRPWDRIEGGDDDQLFTVSDLLRMKKRDRTPPLSSKEDRA